MATKHIMSVIATTGKKLSDLPIKNGQLIFVRDRQTIALDYFDRRTFYNQIITLDSEDDRQHLEDPINGAFYFIVDTAILYKYDKNRWIQVTTGAKTAVCIGIDFPELGAASNLYVSTSEKQIAVWDEGANNFVVVADKTREATNDDIDSLFL